MPGVTQGPPGSRSANDNKVARCLALAESQQPDSSTQQHPLWATHQRYLRITYGHKISVAYSTVPINNNLGEFVFLINSFLWAYTVLLVSTAAAAVFLWQAPVDRKSDAEESVEPDQL